MTLFFDRSVGTRFPKALMDLRLPVGVTYHQLHFAPDESDDAWLPVVGRNGWTVVGHDHSYHKNESELDAILTHNVGVFYMWGSEATSWEKLVVFARAFDKIIRKQEQTERPFLFRVQKNGRVVEDYLPRS